MDKKAKKLSKAKLWTIITASIAIFISLVLIVTNIFIPVKYIASYCVIGRRVKAGTMRVTFVDVGFGDCIIVELPDGKNMLIDGGNGRYSNNTKVFKELNRRDIDTIDYLICSSVNSEHCGGLSEVLKYKSVKTVYMPYCTNKYITQEFCNFVNQTQKCGAEQIFNEFKTGIRNDEYSFIFLSPSVIDSESGEYQDLNSNPSKTTRNNSSAVLWLEYGDTAVLFISDVQSNVLNSLLSSYQLASQDYPVNLEKCKIVQLAGHGNKISTSAMFYDLLSPEAAIISVGKNGSGCPSIQAISDVKNSVGDNLYRTDELGNITIEVTPEGYTIK